MYENRRLVVGALMILMGLTIIGRLLYVQIITDHYREEADMNSRRKVVQYPSAALSLTETASSWSQISRSMTL